MTGVQVEHHADCGEEIGLQVFEETFEVCVKRDRRVWERDQHDDFSLANPDSDRSRVILSALYDACHRYMVRTTLEQTGRSLRGPRLPSLAGVAGLEPLERLEARFPSRQRIEYSLPVRRVGIRAESQIHR
jgi:hypothetical protein